MHITNQDQLKKQKRKLSLIFTLILFGVVTGLQIIFLIGRYLDYANREIQDIETEIFPRHKLQQNMMAESMMWTPPMPMFGKESRGWRLKGGNVILYNPQTQTVVSSSLWDDEFTKDVLQIVVQDNNNKGSIIYNKNRFLYVKQQTSETLESLFLVPVHMQMSDIVRDGLLFMVFFWLLSLLFYRAIYWFVGKMFIPIEENIQDMEQFIFNAGHELKTPLSVIKSHLQLSLAKKQYQKAIDESIKEINKMNALLDSLVNLSVIQYDENKEPLDVAQEIESTVSQYIQIAKSKWISLSIQKESDFILHVHRGYFDMLVGNLVSNAIKYNKKWGKVLITIADWLIKIQDTGIGIPAKEIEKIFDRFYQVGNIRNQEWSGIGLSLVKKIVDMYGWKIDVQSKEKQGTTFIIKFQ